MIGTGARAAAVARLLTAKFGPVGIFDSSGDARDGAATTCALPCRSPVELRARADVVVTLLPDEPALRAVLFGPAGLTQSTGSAPVILDLSPMLPWNMKDIVAQCRQHGVAAFGGSIINRSDDKATMSTLYVDSAALKIDGLQAVVRALGGNVVPTGETGNAKALSLLTELLVGVNCAVVREALAMGQRAGLDTAMLTGLLQKGSGATAVMTARAEVDAGADLCKGLQRAAAAALRVDHSLFFGSAGIASLLAQPQFASGARGAHAHAAERS